MPFTFQLKVLNWKLNHLSNVHFNNKVLHNLFFKKLTTQSSFHPELDLVYSVAIESQALAIVVRSCHVRSQLSPNFRENLNPNWFIVLHPLQSNSYFINNLTIDAKL